MEVSATYTFDAPRQRVWGLLIDPEVIAGCLPGCEAMEPTGDDTYRATLTIAIAAISGRYQGTVRMTDKDEPAGYTLVVEGKGKPGFVNGSASVALADADDGARTSVAVTGKAQVGGTIARVGQRLLGGVSKMMMDRFFACLQERARGDRRRLVTTLLRVLAGVVVLAAAAAGGVGFLVVAFDLQIEFAGNGMRPLLSFGAPDAHYAALEADRGDAGTAVEPVAAGGAASVDPVASGTPGHDAYWTDFRGPHRDGLYTETAIRTEWPATGLEPLWSRPVGGGYASFVVADGRAFTIEQRRDQEVVSAYDVDTGAEVWTHAWPAHFRETMGGPGPRATPTWHDGRLYALGATGRFVCLDAATGAVVWERNILADGGAANLPWAMSGAPLIVDEVVVVQPGGARGWSVAAYDRLTGDVAWHALEDVQAYTSPMLATLGGVRQIVVVTAERAAGLRPADGTLLWEYPWTVPVVPNIAQPLVIGDTRLFLSASYGKGAALMELTPTGDRFTAATVWATNRMKNKFSSSVLIDGYIYGLDESILACIDATTGELMWKGGRYGYGQLLAAGDHLVVLTERGDLVLVRATPNGHEEVAGFRAIEGKTWNVPAMAGGRILVRNARQMAAFDLSP